MDSNSSQSRGGSSQGQTAAGGVSEADSAYRESQQATKSSPQRPSSKPTSALPNILSSFANSSTASGNKKGSPEREEEGLTSKVDRSPVMETYLKSPTAHSEAGLPTPMSGEPPFSPQSDRSSCESTSATAPQQFCLRWNNYQSNLTSVFDQLLQNECFVDVTLACDGRSIKAHKVVLSACSPYFQTLFSTTPCQHPIVIMRDVNWCELKAIVDFMYKGEINVSQEQIGPLLRIAEMLKVRGLADVGSIGGSGGATHLSARQDQTADKELYSSQTAMESPKKHKTDTSPSRNRPPSQSHDSDHERSERDRDILSTSEKEKKRRLEEPDWDSSGTSKNTDSSNLELRLSPLHHEHLLDRNIRKRRWPSADTIFNPPESPLSSLIAAERAEQERERERTREREREKSREVSLFTPPIPVTTCSSGNTSSGISTSLLEPSVHMDITSPSPTPTPNLLPPSRTQSGILTPSPHLQISLHHSHQPHQSHRSSPASSITSTHPSSILSRPLTPSPASVSHSVATGRLEASQMAGDSHRFPLGPAQAAAMAAAAAQMDLGPASALGMRPHSSSVPPMSSGHPSSLADDLEIKPGIAEMIREEERAKMLENSHAWMGASGSSIADSYQYQLQSMWQKCWNTNQSLMHHLRFRERGPLKSWRPETMAEAIFSVLKEGLSLSQAARKYDIPYPTFVLYANRVHNMLGPSIDGGPDLRPKGRGRPQRILLGIWPDEHIKGVIKTVVFRDAKDLKEEGLGPLAYGRHSPVFPFQEGPLTYPGVAGPCPNGMPGAAGDQMSQEATAAAVAAVAHNIRQQMQMAAAAQQQQQLGESHGGPNIFNLPPHMATGVPMGGPPGSGNIPLPKASISPALSSSSNTAGMSSLMGPRHIPSPCGPTLPGMPQLPPSMAVALQMAGTGPGGRCDPSAVLSQQQQHQLQHLHLQQQHALHQQQQQQKHQQQQHQMAFGPHTPSLGHSSVIGTPSHTLVHQTLQKATSSASTKPTSSTSSPTRRNSPHSLTPLHSPLTELGLEMSFKPTRPFSPSRLFSDDISDIVGVAASPMRSPASTIHPSATATVTTATLTTTSSINAATTRAPSLEPSAATMAQPTAAATTSSIATRAVDSSATATSNISSTGIKLEPITTSSD